MIGLLSNNHLALTCSLVICTWSRADICGQRERNLTTSFGRRLWGRIAWKSPQNVSPGTIQPSVSSVCTHASRKNDKNILSIISSKWQLPLTISKTTNCTICKWLKFQMWEAGIHFKFITPAIFQMYAFDSFTHVVRPKFCCMKVFWTVVKTDDVCSISCMLNGEALSDYCHLTGLRPSPQSNKRILQKLRKVF